MYNNKLVEKTLYHARTQKQSPPLVFCYPRLTPSHLNLVFHKNAVMPASWSAKFIYYAPLHFTFCNENIKFHLHKNLALHYDSMQTDRKFIIKNWNEQHLFMFFFNISVIFVSIYSKMYYIIPFWEVQVIFHKVTSFTQINKSKFISCNTSTR